MVTAQFGATFQICFHFVFELRFPTILQFYFNFLSNLFTHYCSSSACRYINCSHCCHCCEIYITFLNIFLFYYYCCHSFKHLNITSNKPMCENVNKFLPHVELNNFVSDTRLTTCITAMDKVSMVRREQRVRVQAFISSGVCM